MSNRSTLLLEHHLKELRLPTFLRSTASWPPSAPPRMWTTLTTCCVSPNWNSLTDTSAWCSAGSGPPVSLPSKAWTPSTSWPYPR